MIVVHATRRICLKVEFVGVMIQIRYTEERLTSDERSEARRRETWAEASRSLKLAHTVSYSGTPGGAGAKPPRYGLFLPPIYTSCKPPARVTASLYTHGVV